MTAILPRTFGRGPTGHCLHCNAGPACHATSRLGVFCTACFRWLEYVGIPQEFGDGMWQPEDGRHLRRAVA